MMANDDLRCIAEDILLGCLSSAVDVAVNGIVRYDYDLDDEEMIELLKYIEMYTRIMVNAINVAF